MTDYNFETLNDMEFEELANDLISKKLDVFVERFKPGKDQGVDGRFFTHDGGEVIIQSKHYLKSGYDALLRHCKNTESDKVRKLNPTRYIFVCSTPLNRRQKRELSKVFSPFLLEQDIFSKENLNDLLKKFPDIEKNHYKLWLPSTNVLENLLNADIEFDIQNEIDAIKRTAEKYVKTLVHDKANKILSRDNCVVILGEPGVGKTSLARMLCYEYMSCENEYELVFIESDIKDANKKFKSEKYQIFYFDDFLGSNYLKLIEDNKDSRIAKFIDRVINDPYKKFVLTSRTTIFNQGCNVSEKLEHADFSSSKLCLNANDISPLDKARILYNHLYFAKDPDHEYYDYISKIFENERYFEVIRHKNYSPRIIELILNKKSLSSISSDKYWDYIINSLDFPDKVWEYHVKDQLNEHEQLVTWLVSLVRRVSEDSLKSAFLNITKLHNDIYNFRCSLKSLDGAIIKSENKGSKNIYFSLQNPSIRDYVVPTLLNNYKFLSDCIIELGGNFSSSTIPNKIECEKIRTLWCHIIEKIDLENITTNTFTLGITSLRRITYRKPKFYMWSSKLEIENYETNLTVKKFTRNFNLLIEWFYDNRDVSSLNYLDLINQIAVISSALNNIDSVDWKCLFNDLYKSNLDHNDLVDVSSLLSIIEDYSEIDDLLSDFSEEVSIYWSGEIDNKIDYEFDESVLYEGRYSVYTEGMDVNDIDEYETYSEVESYVSEIIEEVLNEYDVSLSIADEIVQNVDIDEYNERAINYLKDVISDDENPVIYKNKTKNKVLKKAIKQTNRKSEIDRIKDIFN
ncbi:conserved hypothetical protein [Vibrio chagasii]|uniref:nSTAND3 domain-containing NTPase n=1 Tax=Vibrio splendidus TaxID=29497 RepID=UPI000CF425B0|nr:ATP-binding protein [Vibrio splendidus]PQJ48580.1 hypothetical protein BTO12_24440 [Vibrio splendidus]CAH7358194.1 conserved hypothetical protein [Vibrio chagasii]CAH7454142.1 conserved hypothetical protein [Vibrio chagasii]